MLQREKWSVSRVTGSHFPNRISEIGDVSLLLVLRGNCGNKSGRKSKFHLPLSLFSSIPQKSGNRACSHFGITDFFLSILTKKQQLSGLKIEVFYSAPFFFFASLLKYCTQSIFRIRSIDSEKGVKWWGKRPRGQFPKIRNGYFLWETVFIKTYFLLWK